MGSQLIGKFAKVAAAASATAGGYYAYRVYRNTTAIDTPIIASRSIPDSLRQSWTVKELINRNNHPAVMDSQYTELAARFREVPDTVLLARFLRGFFGGYVFGPERVALQAVGIDLVHMSRIQDTAPAIWSTTELSDTALPALHTKLFGAFQVVEITLGESESYVDIVFGSDTSEFGGVHRFAIQRTESSVQVHLQHLVCNPTKPKKLSPEILLDFHLVYANMLFRESIKAITR